MKTGRIILFIVLVLFSILKWSSKCSKERERNLHSGFNEKCTAVETKKQLVLAYMQFGSDSAEKTRFLTRSMDSTLSYAIDHYRINYEDDKKRYQSYLEVLFVYKKMVYAFQKWYKDQKPDSDLHKNKDKTATTNDLDRELTRLSFELQHKRMAVAFKN